MTNPESVTRALSKAVESSVRKRILTDMHNYMKYKSGDFPVNPFQEPNLIDTVNNVRVEFLPTEIAGEPEVTAMLGAFYSRSPMPIAERLVELGNIEAIKHKLGNVVVGYGHASVLDMVNVSIFIERIPILAAVAIENHALFAGQETSTRYVSWENGEFINPFSGQIRTAVDDAYAMLRDTYIKVQRGAAAKIEAANADLLSSADDVAEKSYMRAIAARSFDIARGFLPSSAVTSVVWNTRLSAILAHLEVMAVHYDPFVVLLARKIHDALRTKFPDSVSELSTTTTYGPDYWMTPKPSVYHEAHTQTERILLAMQERHRGQRVAPRHQHPIRLFGSIDYGSFRDLNRHRVGYKDLPAPHVRNSIHPWYTNMSQEHVDFDLGKLPSKIADMFANVSANRHDVWSYVAPMGSIMDVDYIMPLHQYFYLAELRSGPAIHPTLRRLVQRAHESCVRRIPSIAPLIYVDMRPDPGPNGFILSRGKDTIFVNGNGI